MVYKYVREQTIRASHDSNMLRDMFRYLKSRQFNLRARPNVVFDGEWMQRDLPENFAT